MTSVLDSFDCDSDNEMLRHKLSVITQMIENLREENEVLRKDNKMLIASRDEEKSRYIELAGTFLKEVEGCLALRKENEGLKAQNLLIRGDNADLPTYLK